MKLAHWSFCLKHNFSRKKSHNFKFQGQQQDWNHEDQEVVLKVQSWLYTKELMELVEWYISLPLKIDFILMEILTLAEKNRCLHETFSQLWNELTYHPSRQGQSFKSLSTCPDYTIDMYQLQNGLNGLIEIGYLTFLMHENGMASIWIPQCRKQILITLLTFSFYRLNWIFAIFPSLVEMYYWYLCPSGDQRIRNIIKFPKLQFLRKNGKNYCFVYMEKEFWLKILLWN